MYEYRFDEIFEEINRREYAEFDRPTWHSFSLRHRKAMRKILHPDICTKPFKNRIGQSLIPLRKRLFIVAVLIFLAVITGAVVLFRIAGFSGTAYPDNIHLLALNDPAAPKAIEELYCLTELPIIYEYTDGYGDIGERSICRIYTDTNSGNCISFHQYVKSAYNAHFDHEHSEFVEIEINEHDGFIWRAKEPGHKLKAIVWDNGDYIFCIDGNLDENEMINLAKSAKIF